MDLEELFKEDIKLPVDSDLTFYSFVEAYNLLNKFYDDLIDSDTFNEFDFRFVFDCIEVNFSSYHSAAKISYSSDIWIEIDPQLDTDAWKYTRTYSINNKFYTKSVYSPGA